jgi:hypothetical protein
MIAERTAAVLKMLPAESPEARRVSVVHDCAGQILESVATEDQAVAQLAILGRPKGGVKSPDCTKQHTRDREVVGAEQARTASIGVVLVVDHVDDGLAGSGVPITG